MKKFLINETERKHILKLYNIINDGLVTQKEILLSEMAVKKGASPAQIIEIIETLLDGGANVNSPDFKSNVIVMYNSIFGKASKDTIVANLREDAMVKFQENRVIIKLPQDNSKVDLVSIDIIDGVIDIRVSQQKGNDASFNSSSLSNTLDGLISFIDNDKIRQYFHLFPDHLNPLKTNLPYNVDVIIGMILACGEGSKTKNGREIMIITNDDYLRYMGITTKDVCDLDHWVNKQLKNRNHCYAAVDKCENFDYIYNTCLELVLNDRDQ